MAAGDYHTDEQLRALGEQIRDRAIQISVEQELSSGILGSVLRTPLDDPIPAGAWHPATSIEERVQDILTVRMKYWAGPRPTASRPATSPSCRRR